MRARRLGVFLVFAHLGVAFPALAQEPGQAAARPAGEAAPADQGGEGLELIFEREIFLYTGAGRRDPFAPLVGPGFGPRFEDLSLKGIIYSPAPGQSVALLTDGTGKIHRVRTGDVVGNARVTQIAPLRVTFAVEDFGVIRQDFLELKKRQGGVEG